MNELADILERFRRGGELLAMSTTGARRAARLTAAMTGYPPAAGANRVSR